MKTFFRNNRTLSTIAIFFAMMIGSLNAQTINEDFKILATDGATNNIFGGSVSIDGDTALVGAYGDDDNGGNSGSAYLFDLPAPQISVAPASIDLTTITINIATTATLTIGNTGSADLNVSGLTHDLGDLLTVSPQTFTIVPNGSTDVTLTINPTSAGVISGTLTINSNDPNSPTTVSIVGTAIEDAVLSVKLSAFGGSVIENGLELKWRTESEVNNVGFSVYRSESKNGNFVKIAFVDGHGSTAIAHDYVFTDLTAEIGKTYFYQIEDLDRYGNADRSPILEITFELPTLAEIIPDRFELFQNFPNPFNPETWIPFDLAENSKVAITIFNSNGDPIRTLDLGEISAGSYVTKSRAIHWDGKNNFGEIVGSGVYFYGIKTDHFSAIRKMIILK